MKIDTDLRNHPDVLWYPRWDSWANVKADWSTWPNTYGDAPNTWPKLFFTTAPEFGGIPVGRFESVSTNPNTTNQMSLGVMDIMFMRKYFNENSRGMYTGTTLGSVPLNDLYSRYCIMVESDVWAGMNEYGMKLPGLENDTQRGGMDTVMWHDHPGATTGKAPFTGPYELSDPMRLTTYWGGGDLRGGSTYGGDWIKPPKHDNIYIQPNRWYCIEQHLVMSSYSAGVSNYDGLLDLWIDDELILSLRNIKTSSGPSPGNPATGAEIQQFFGLIYHGGMYRAPLTPIHYRMTGVAVAKKRIGMPKRVY